MLGMAEIQVTWWRDLPSLVVARDGDDVVKVPLPQRFQEAIDEAAMRLGAVDSTAYLDGWTRSPWEVAEGDIAAVAQESVRGFEDQWSDEAIATYLDAVGPAQG
jgi:Virulence factor